MYPEYKNKTQSEMATNVSPDIDVRDQKEEDIASHNSPPHHDKANKSFKSAVVIIPPETCWEQIQEIRKVHDKGYERWMPHISMIYPFVADINDGQVFADAATKFQLALSGIQPFKVKLESFMHFTHKKYCTLWLKPEIVGGEERIRTGEVVALMADPPVTNAAAVSNDKPEVKVTPEHDRDKQQGAAGGEASLDNEEMPFAATSFSEEPTVPVGSKSKKQLKKEAKQKLKLQRQQEELEKLGKSHPFVVQVQQALEGQFTECNDVSAISEKGFTPHLSVGQFSSKEVEEYAKTFGESFRSVEFEVKEVCLISREDFHDPFHIRQTVQLGKTT